MTDNYENRVNELEKEGMTRSDAQAVADAENLKEAATNDSSGFLNDTLRDIAGTHLDRPVWRPIGTECVTPMIEREQTAGWLDENPDVVRDVLARRSENRSTLIDWIRVNLKEGHDYGVIKGRKSLWKAGAEKIAGMLGLQVNWPDLDREMERLREGNAVVFLTCTLTRNGVVQAQGAGARSVDQDSGDFNKAIKMCKKSAMIDAVLNVAGLSEVFTQDIEDDDIDHAELSEASQNVLRDVADRCFGEIADDVLESLARRRFHIGNGDWRKIPSFRLADAIRSLEEKAKGDLA